MVLTVNTFTANLAAFLTVERMVSTGEVAPQSLEEMINEPGINFTVRYLMILHVALGKNVWLLTVESDQHIVKTN